MNLDSTSELIENIDTEIKNGGTDKKIKATDLYNQLISIINNAGVQIAKKTLTVAELETVFDAPLLLLPTPGQ